MHSDSIVARVTATPAADGNVPAVASTRHEAGMAAAGGGAAAGVGGSAQVVAAAVGQMRWY
eukprot:COSAG01_NODE_66_length_29241_cov_17.772768_32_plen_61_part_00